MNQVLNSLKSEYRVALIIAACAIVTLCMIFVIPADVTNIEYLGGLLLLEALAAVLWNYRQRFFPALILVFLFSGTNIPMRDAFGAIRWLVLGAGAVVGIAIYCKGHAVSSLRSFHWVAFSCVVAAAISAEVSSFPKLPLLKALSLLLLFLYGSFGARVTIMNREDRFIEGLLWGSEGLVYFAAVQYFLLHREFFGNPNSLGGVMAVAAAPLLLWGTLTGENPQTQRRRGFALLLSLTLILTSYSRAGIVAATISCTLMCVLLCRYRILIKGLVAVLVIAAVVGSIMPLEHAPAGTTLSSRYLFKGKEQGGVLASRRSVWDSTISSIEQHPWFGIGFGSAAARNQDDIDQVGTFSSNSTTTKEHGDSYLAILEGVGLLGGLSFIGLLLLTLLNIGRIFNHLWRTRDPFSAAVPIAFVLLAGLINAMFEDWLFAVGSYLCVFFWILAFMLPDLISAPAQELSRSGFRPMRMAENDLLVSVSR